MTNEQIELLTHLDNLRISATEKFNKYVDQINSDTEKYLRIIFKNIITEEIIIKSEIREYQWEFYISTINDKFGRRINFTQRTKWNGQEKVCEGYDLDFTNSSVRDNDVYTITYYRIVGKFIESIALKDNLFEYLKIAYISFQQEKDKYLQESRNYSTYKAKLDTDIKNNLISQLIENFKEGDLYTLATKRRDTETYKYIRLGKVMKQTVEVNFLHDAIDYQTGESYQRVYSCKRYKHLDIATIIINEAPERVRKITNSTEDASAFKKVN